MPLTPPSPQYKVAFFEQENWPPGMEVSLICTRQPTEIKIEISGDNFELVSENCKITGKNDPLWIQINERFNKVKQD